MVTQGPFQQLTNHYSVTKNVWIFRPISYHSSQALGFIRRGQSVEFSVKQQREPGVSQPRPPSCHGSNRQPGSRDGRAPPASSPPVPSVMAVSGSHEDGVNTATSDAAPWFGAESFMLSCHRRKTQTFRRLLRSQRWRTAASICRLCLKRSGTSWQSWIWSCPKVSFGGG